MNLSRRIWTGAAVVLIAISRPAVLMAGNCVRASKPVHGGFPFSPPVRRSVLATRNSTSLYKRLIPA